jgi:hypothetical protein
VITDKKLEESDFNKLPAPVPFVAQPTGRSSSNRSFGLGKFQDNNNSLCSSF